jgi:hypothetical protein
MKYAALLFITLLSVLGAYKLCTFIGSATCTSILFWTLLSAYALYTAIEAISVYRAIKSHC